MSKVVKDLRSTVRVRLWITTERHWFRPDTRALVMRTESGAEVHFDTLGESWADVPDSYLGEFYVEFRRA